MPEELIFEMDYKGETHGIKFNLESASEQDVAHAISHVLPLVNAQAFHFSGINTKAIDEFASSLSVPTASEALKGTSASAIRAALESAAKENPLLFPAAESYFYSALLGKYALPSLPSQEMFQGKLHMEKTHPKGKVALLAKFKSWIAIKKMGIVPGVQDYEVSAALCAINETLVKKAFDFAQIDLVALGTHAKKLASGKRKSYQNVGEVLSMLPEKGKKDIENAYLLFAVLRELKVSPYAQREMLMKAHPDVKIPKPRGRVAKG